MLFLGKANLDIVELTTHRCPYPRQAREHTVVPGNVDGKLPVDVTVADLLNRLSEPSNPVQ
jgi:hypothetical protein